MGKSKEAAGPWRPIREAPRQGKILLLRWDGEVFLGEPMPEYKSFRIPEHGYRDVEDFVAWAEIRKPSAEAAALEAESHAVAAAHGPPGPGQSVRKM